MISLMVDRLDCASGPFRRHFDGPSSNHLVLFLGPRPPDPGREQAGTFPRKAHIAAMVGALRSPSKGRRDLSPNARMPLLSPPPRRVLGQRFLPAGAFDCFAPCAPNCRRVGIFYSQLKRPLVVRLH